MLDNKNIGEEKMNKLFKLKENGTNFKTEVVAGLTTFFAMAYIIFVNPGMLGTGTDANMPTAGVMIATCLSAALGTWLIGWLTNYPLAQAPGMGLNAVFAYTLCGTLGLSYNAALAAVFLSGILFIVLTVTGARKAIVNAIPLSMKKAISCGIGLFIALLGLNNAGLLSNTNGTVIGLGSFAVPTTLLAVFGLILVIVLLALKIKGALILSIIGTSAVGCFVQFVFGVDMGITLPTTWVPDLDFSLMGAAFKGGFEELLAAPIASLASVIITLLLVDMFDTIGTLIGAADKAGYLDENGNLPKVERAMLADAIATSAGAAMGTSTVTTYVESTAGIAAGGKTGLTSTVTGLCFALAIFASPILGFVPSAATAPVLVMVGVMMAGSLKDIEWKDLDVAIPCFMTVIGMPLFYSITDGIAFGFISYVIVKLATRKFKEIHPLMYVIVALFILKYVLSVL